MASIPSPDELRAAPADALNDRARTHYEVYVRTGDRFELREVSDDQEAALGVARRFAARPDALVRVMCEAYDPERDETVERIVFDSAAAGPERRLPTTSEPFPREAEPPGQRPFQAPQPEPVPKLVVAFGGLTIAMALAAATMAIF